MNPTALGVAVLAAAGAFALVTGPVTGFVIGLAGAGWVFVTVVSAHQAAKRRVKRKRDNKRKRKAEKAAAETAT